MAITDRITGALPSNTVKNPKLNAKSIALVLSARSYPTGDPQRSPHPLNLINAVKSYKYVESLELGKNGSAFIQGEMPKRMEDPGLFTLPCRLGDSKPFDTLADLGSCVNIIPLYLFKKLNIGLLEETDHVFRVKPSRQEEFEDLVMNFILDQEEKVRQLEEYMCVIGSDFMQLSLEVVGKLKDKDGRK
ncbi:hypothetical protein Tco_0680292 [Tanacetum coccineum]|uniref:Uncharacterized protein n=1 Tax=Tanacetum coccineum TaxID=301880 RepID=A0ABQ4XK57_9ASTR